MTQTKTVAILLLIAVAVIGTIGIGTTEHAFASLGPGQNDNSKGDSNNQGAIACGFQIRACAPAGENFQGNQP